MTTVNRGIFYQMMHPRLIRFRKLANEAGQVFSVAEEDPFGWAFYEGELQNIKDEMDHIKEGETNQHVLEQMDLTENELLKRRNEVTAKWHRTKPRITKRI